MNKSKHFRLLLLLFCVCFLLASVSVQAKEVVGMVTSYRKITWGIHTGEFYVNGIHAFCCQYNQTTPPAGTEISSISLCENEIMRKILYYGYKGPANVLGTDERAHVLTAIAVSDANIGERATGASAKYDAFYWDIVNNPSTYPTPPDNFKIYMAVTTSATLQDLVYYDIEKNGYVRVVKTSSDPQITEGNLAYSLEGAQYGLYSDASLSESTRVGTLTTDEKGNTNVAELSAGTYYVCELVAPKGYEKSETVTAFTVTPQETTVLQLTNDPKTNTTSCLLEKVDAQTGEHKPQGFATLQGAEFTVKYYAGLWEDGVDPAALGQVPKKEWVFQTDEEGMVYFTKEYQCGGDDLYEELPFGTVTIQESKPSPGYLLNETVFVKQMTETNEYRPPVVAEEYDAPDPYRLRIHKTDDYENMLCGAEFSLYCDEICAHEFAQGTTDENGVLQFEGLEIGTRYYLKETKAPAGYQITTDDNGKERIYEIYAVYIPATQEFTYYIDGKAFQTTETTANWEAKIQIVNDVGYQLPKTGSHAGLITSMTGIALCGISMYLLNKEKRRKLL